jgi:dUTPase
MAQQALALRRGLGTELQPVGHTLLAHFAFDLAPYTLTTIRSVYMVRLAEGTFGLIAPKPEITQQGLDVKLAVVSADFRGCLEIALESRRSHLWHVEVGQPLAQFIVMPFCPLTVDPPLSLVPE